MQRVALFGGSFNPPHAGHVLVVAWLLSSSQVDEVWLVPTGVHPFGKTLAPFADRAAMARAAVAPFGAKARVEEIEATLPAPSFTIDTVQALRARHPDTVFSLVVGTDILLESPKWREFDRLKTLVALLPVRRAGVPGSVPDPDPARPTPLFPEISSSDVRARIARGEAVDGLVPAAVLDRIRASALYRG